jgi:dihydroorotate dehydrogenase
MSAYRLLRPILFRLDPERVHDLTLRMLGLAGRAPIMPSALRRRFCYERPSLAVRIFGIDFPNPLGLAAGYDKDGRAMQGLACLGFGHLEIGTVTVLPQAGNPKPRIFRLAPDEAIINRMGFPNRGAAALLRRLRGSKPQGVILGVNIGKGQQTPLERAAEDYVALLAQFYAHVDYVAVNVSSPNTIGLRRLQARAQLEDLLKRLEEQRDGLYRASGRRMPILVKLSPDLQHQELEDALAAITATGMDGVIATNTTVDRAGLLSPQGCEEGGLSGAPLRSRATAMVADIHRLAGGSLPIVAAGGVLSLEDACEKLDAGAALVQLYSGLVYRGPGLVREILQGLAQRNLTRR